MWAVVVGVVGCGRCVVVVGGRGVVCGGAGDVFGVR